jgi:hypothetical protein
VLLGQNVFDVVCEMTVFLPEQAVFTAIPGPPADQIPYLGVRHGWAFEASLPCALSLRIAMKSAALMSASKSDRSSSVSIPSLAFSASSSTLR